MYVCVCVKSINVTSMCNLRDGSIWTPGANEEQAPEAVERFVIRVGDRLLLRGFLIEPAPPLLLMTADLLAYTNARVHVNTNIYSYRLIY